jgi:hypothetical protein
MNEQIVVISQEQDGHADYIIMLLESMGRLPTRLNSEIFL